MTLWFDKRCSFSPILSQDKQISIYKSKMRNLFLNQVFNIIAGTHEMRMEVEHEKLPGIIFKSFVKLRISAEMNILTYILNVIKWASNMLMTKYISDDSIFRIIRPCSTTMLCRQILMTRRVIFLNITLVINSCTPIFEIC